MKKFLNYFWKCLIGVTAAVVIVYLTSVAIAYVRTLDIVFQVAIIVPVLIILLSALLAYIFAVGSPDE